MKSRTAGLRRTPAPSGTRVSPTPVGAVASPRPVPADYPRPKKSSEAVLASPSSGRRRYADKGANAIAFAMNEEFGGVIQTQLEFYNGPQADQFATVHKKLDDVKNVMARGRAGHAIRCLHVGNRVSRTRCCGPANPLSTQVQNIEMVLERGEKLELLVDKHRAWAVTKTSWCL